MKSLVSVLTALLISGLSFFSSAKNAPPKADYAVEAVPLTQVDITDQFWAPKQEVNRTVSIQHCITEAEKRGGTTIGGGILEGAGYAIAKRRDPAFEEYIRRRVDATAARFAAASGGASQAMRGGGPSPEAAVAYFEATEDRRLLDQAISAADAADAVYGPGKKGLHLGSRRPEDRPYPPVPASPETRNTGSWPSSSSISAARPSTSSSRPDEYPGEREYNQNHKPVLEQDEAVGHAVRAMYLYIPLTDIAALTGQPEYAKADDALWEDVVSRENVPHGRNRLHPAAGKVRRAVSSFRTSAPGTRPAPHTETWCGTTGCSCSTATPSTSTRWRRVLYNGFLVGVSLKGDRFFYQNVLMSYGNYDRFDWINVPCCPPNVVRLMAQLGELHLCAEADKRPLRQPLCRLQGRREARQNQRQDHPGNALSLGRQRQDDDRSREGREVRPVCPDSGMGPEHSPCRAISTPTWIRPKKSRP